MGTTPIFGFPWPELASQADGPAAFQALATKLETTMGASARVFSQTLAGHSWGSGVQTDALTSVPLGRPVSLTVAGVIRVSGASNFAVIEVYDGVVGVTTQWPVVGATIGFNLSFHRVFNNIPTLKYTNAGAGGVTIDDNVAVQGVSWNWPS